MKILLLNPPFLPRYSRSQRSPAVTKSGTLYYPIWLCYSAAILEEHGFEIKIIDSPADNLSNQETLEIIKEYSPELAVIDTSTPSIYNDVEISSLIKQQNPECFTLLVGTHVSVLAEETLLLSNSIDCIARGEYDLTILEIANRIKHNDLNLNFIDGISYRENNTLRHNPDRQHIAELDKIPFVSRIYKKHLKIKNYFFAASLYPEIQIITARGCPFKCFFCLWPQTFQGRDYRTRSPENILAEFIYIKNNLPMVKGVVIEDDTFTVDNNRVRRICELLIKEKIGIKWNANVRTNLDLETMKIMKAAGCYLLIVGIESTSQDILDNIDKGLHSTNIKTFFNNAKKTRLLVHAAFMAGNPGETEESLRKDLSLAKMLLPDTIQFFPLMPYPGTKAYSWAKNNGYLKINSFRDYLNEHGLHNTVIDLPGLSGKQLVKWCNYSRRSYYLSLSYFWYKLKQVITNPWSCTRTLRALATFRKYILKPD
ncbi:MAG: radical SAM protein [Candidatus Omnitrophota bacterium]